MLLPHSLDAVVPAPWQWQFRIDGAALEEEGKFIAPGLVPLASESYVAAYDPDLDVLTEWRALIEGQVAQRISVTHLNTLSSPAATRPPGRGRLSTARPTGTSGGGSRETETLLHGGVQECHLTKGQVDRLKNIPQRYFRAWG
jgi:hypothetical protein